MYGLLAQDAGQILGYGPAQMRVADGDLRDELPGQVRREAAQGGFDFW